MTRESEAPAKLRRAITGPMLFAFIVGDVLVPAFARSWAGFPSSSVGCSGRLCLSHSCVRSDNVSQKHFVGLGLLALTQLSRRRGRRHPSIESQIYEEGVS